MVDVGRKMTTNTMKEEWGRKGGGRRRGVPRCTTATMAEEEKEGSIRW